MMVLGCSLLFTSEALETLIQSCVGRAFATAELGLFRLPADSGVGIPCLPVCLFSGVIGFPREGCVVSLWGWLLDSGAGEVKEFELSQVRIRIFT